MARAEEKLWIDFQSRGKPALTNIRFGSNTDKIIQVPNTLKTAFHLHLYYLVF